MDRSGHTVDTQGFEFSRRSVLVGGATVAATGSLAGCSSSDDPDSDPAPTEETSDLVAEGLSVLDVDVVSDDGGWMDLRDDEEGDPDGDLAADYATRSHVRVLIENEREEAISAVNLAVEAFDDDMQFLGVTEATIASLRSGEVFEGYVPHLYGDAAAAYVVRADASRRPDPVTALEDLDEPLPSDDVSVADHCREGNTVRGTLEHAGSSEIERLRVDVRFYDDGDLVGSASDTVSGLEPGEDAEFRADFGESVEPAETTVADYGIFVSDDGGQSLALR